MSDCRGIGFSTPPLTVLSTCRQVYMWGSAGGDRSASRDTDDPIFRAHLRGVVQSRRSARPWRLLSSVHEASEPINGTILVTGAHVYLQNRLPVKSGERQNRWGGESRLTGGDSHLQRQMASSADRIARISAEKGGPMNTAEERRTKGIRARPSLLGRYASAWERSDWRARR
jgi:hypothetical protein